MKKKFTKIWGIGLILVLIILMVAPATVASAKNQNQNEFTWEGNVGHLYLYEKTPSGEWPIVEDGAWAKMNYSLSGPEFEYLFNGHGLNPSDDYTLIYYADKPDRFNSWGGDNPGAFIASGTTNRGGNLHLAGSVELNMDLPCPPDANFSDGAKIWLVLSEDYNVAKAKLEAWNPTEYLFEKDLITYDDTDGEMLCLDNKNPSGWDPILDGTLGILLYGPSGSTFDFAFNGRGLSLNTDYSLIYYADGWPGNNPGALIDTGTSDGSGGISMSGSIDLDMDLPDPADANYSTYGAKIWLVPSSDYNALTNSMKTFVAARYLFEMNGIYYDDTDN